MKQSLSVQALRVLVALLIAFNATGAALASDTGKLEGYIGAVKAALPQGWSMQNSQAGTTPPDWYTHDEQAGVLLYVGNATEYQRTFGFSLPIGLVFASCLIVLRASHIGRACWEAITTS